MDANINLIQHTEAKQVTQSTLRVFQASTTAHTATGFGKATHRLVLTEQEQPDIIKSKALTHWSGLSAVIVS